MNYEEGRFFTGGCQACGQKDIGQKGDNPCPACGLPTLWDGTPEFKSGFWEYKRLILESMLESRNVHIAIRR